jgi:hypothetical protein
MGLSFLFQKSTPRTKRGLDSYYYLGNQAALSEIF